MKVFLISCLLILLIDCVKSEDGFNDEGKKTQQGF